MQKIKIVGLIFLFSTLLLLIPARAQTGSQTLINNSEITDPGNGLGLGLYFTVVDSAGRPLPEVQPRSALIVLDDGSSYDVQTEQVDTPLYITLLLDASGSMRPVAEDMKQAAIRAIERVPDGANIAVVSFNEELQVLQEFTTGTNRAINALKNYQPLDDKGTCVYDSAYTVIQDMLQAVNDPTARRALVLFTDGRDELHRGQGDTCSTHSYAEVLGLVEEDNRVSIHTIGLVGGDFNIDRDELEDMASATGGFSAIGDQTNLADLFRQIMDGLSSQWLASTTLFTTQGEHTATLIVTLQNGALLEPDAITFTAPFDTSQLAATEAQPTTPPPSVQIRSVTCNGRDRTISVETVVGNGGGISQFRFDLRDAGNNRDELGTRAAPLEPIEVFDTPDLAGGQYTVVIYAFDADGNEIARSGEERCTYAPPTSTPTPSPTPTQPTSTPLPVGANLDNVQFDATTQVFRLFMRLNQLDQIGSLRVEVVNASTSSLEKTYNPAVGEVVEVPIDELSPGDYNVTVISLGSTGEELSRSSRTITKTPPTATPTPESMVVRINPQPPAPGATELLVNVEIREQEQGTQYLVKLTNPNKFTESFTFIPPPYDSFRLPLTKLSEPGQYELVLEVQDANGTKLAEALVAFTYTPPPTPTATPEPPPPPPPPPGTPWAIIILIAAVIVSLIVFLAWYIRSSSKPTKGNTFLSELTGMQNVPSPLTNTSESDNDRTNIEFDPEATNAVPQMLLPLATFRVQQSLDVEKQGTTFTITHVPFRLGRSGRGDLNFNDKNVSRPHVEITYRDGLFYIADLNSTHGTLIGTAVLDKNGMPVQLNDGVVITLGKTTILEFHQEQTAGFDPHQTNIEER
jgi:VWFA-related protein